MDASRTQKTCSRPCLTPSFGLSCALPSCGHLSLCTTIPLFTSAQPASPAFNRTATMPCWLPLRHIHDAQRASLLQRRTRSRDKGTIGSAITCCQAVSSALSSTTAQFGGLFAAWQKQVEPTAHHPSSRMSSRPHTTSQVAACSPIRLLQE